MVAALLKAGAAVEKANIALYMAAQEGHTAVLVALLGAGAEVGKTSEDGRTPLWTAV
jgi:ankyrin repeat protein